MAQGGKVLWALAIAGCTCTNVLAIPYLVILFNKPRSVIRQYFFATTIMPVVFSLSAIFICLSPEYEEVWGLFEHVAEAWALHSLNCLIVARLGGMTNTVQKLQARGSDNWLRSPPLCCLCFCLPHFVWDKQVLERVLLLTRQFMFIAPSISVAGIGLSLSGSFSDLAYLLFRLLLLGSSLTALYGLFVLYKATHPLTKHARITLKFLAVKLVILIGVIQEAAFKRSSDRERLGPAAGRSPEDLALILPHALLAVESPFLTILLLFAFPLHELNASSGPSSPLLAYRAACGSSGTQTSRVSRGIGQGREKRYQGLDRADSRGKLEDPDPETLSKVLSV